LPWSWVPPFPWLHAHAQWSDAALAVAAAAWFAARLQSGEFPRLLSAHLAMGLYLVAAILSFVFAASPAPSAPGKLLGMGALVALALVTGDLAGRPGKMPAIARTVAVTGLLTAVAAVAGEVFFLLGYPSRLVGTYGDLQPGFYARAQAGLYHPNLLASYCIFAAAIVDHPHAGLPPRLRRAALLGLWVAVLLTFSRGILAFVLSALVRRASGPRSRKLAAAYAVFAVAVVANLALWNVSLDPTRPHRWRVDPAPSSRLSGATTAWKTLNAKPLWGSGPGSSPAFWRGGPFDAHLTPLNVAATLGLPALAAFLAIPVLLWRGRQRPTDRAIWGALAGMGLDGLAQDVEDFRHLWILFGLASGAPPSHLGLSRWGPTPSAVAPPTSRLRDG